MTSKDNNPHDIIPEYNPSFDKVPSFNEQSIDYKRLKNIPPIPSSYILPDASTTIKGGVKLATAPSSPTNPVAVGDNDPRLTKYFASGITTLASGISVSTITVGFTPSYVRITSGAGSNYSAFFTSGNKSGNSNGIGFDFQSGFGTTIFSSNFAVDVRRNGQKYESTIAFATNQFVLNHNWSQFTTEIMWEAFA